MQAVYRAGPVPSKPQIITPLDPRLRVLLLALRQACLIVAAGIAEYCQLAKHD